MESMNLQGRNSLLHSQKQKHSANPTKNIVMKRSSKAENILSQINTKTKLGDLRKIAKNIKTDHDLALELWSTGKFFPRLLAILVMDNKLLVPDLINMLD